MAGGYEVGTHAESPYAPPPAHFAPPPPPPLPAVYGQVQQDFPGSQVDPYEFSSQEQRQTWTVPSPGAPVAPQPAASSILEHRTQPLAGILDDLDFGEADDDDSAPGPEVHMAGDGPRGSLMDSPLANAAAHLDAPERDTGPVTPPPPVVAARDTGPIPPLPSVAPERDTGPVTPLPEVTLETEQPPPAAIARTSVEQEVDQSAERVASPPAVPTPGQVSDRNELPPPRVGPPAFAAEPDVRHVVLGFRDGSAVFLEADHPLFGLFFQWSELVAGPSMPEKLYARPRRAPDMFVGRPSRGKVTRES
ncbi:MAG: hypothetical protein DCC49_04310 [Acidobacteria bacterium]|nr:MAG: hypothetical protein DCC49_04310 [Acidobacteriota bacterium]